MLSKEICKSCINYIDDDEWVESDEENWSKGIISCLINLERSIYKPPPDSCKYRLEHLMATDGKSPPEVRLNIDLCRKCHIIRMEECKLDEAGIIRCPKDKEITTYCEIPQDCPLKDYHG